MLKKRLCVENEAQTWVVQGSIVRVAAVAVAPLPFTCLSLFFFFFLSFLFPNTTVPKSVWCEIELL